MSSNSGYRSFDRQYLIADSRLIHRPAPPIWEARIPGQIYAVELHSEYPRSGPGLSFSALIPDMHFFRGSGGGRTLPLLHPDGTANVAPGLTESLGAIHGRFLPAEEVLFYMAGIASHPGFVETFDAELHTPGVRIPITSDPGLWNRAVELGKYVIWLHTYGDKGAHPRGSSHVRAEQAELTLPSYDASVGTAMPAGIEYDSDLETIGLGAGRWTNVTAEVRNYTVGGSNVLDSWIGYRRADPRGKRTSPLDDLIETSWPGEGSLEFIELLSVLTQLVALQPKQEQLLADVLASPLVSRTDLEQRGTSWPTNPKHRRVRRVDPNQMSGTDLS
ncbi:type ISP restriction/modification enzyme [Plantibacter elymi (nom. nud.)]|uniref:type ISP restriction/modification enzyme n=1 Tax=Plantibacter elymi (nom. nud.) TaxID=199708 RepID=UPI0013FD91B3